MVNSSPLLVSHTPQSTLVPNIYGLSYLVVLLYLIFYSTKSHSTVVHKGISSSRASATFLSMFDLKS
jgi:hypothetical protein